MAELNVRDWGRIYAYVWQQDRIGNVHYKILLEEDPVLGIKEVIQALNKKYPNLEIHYEPDNKDVVWDVAPPAGLRGKPNLLKEYRSGKLPATMAPNFAC